MGQAPVPLIVLSGREDDVELVNRSLRDGGHPVRCHWVAKVDKLLGALQELGPELLCFFPDSLPVAIREIAKSLDLKSPFESNAPVHLKYSTDLKPAKAAAAAE